eukprot:gnl/TRDRNA2_/TRDRNA2_28114_c0_seq1.p1 gnl/TRDRNA2_/TRDRNA2_28114_c0~~gnl/TRDRNA2_/TRDRNA2_28114_c0_seq1.p1  ORF type:complete len:630 (+),score=91.16 gnl/TRDRNA2_/TRDRNA2_28114_c0_seq1:148-2037(+)
MEIPSDGFRGSWWRRSIWKPRPGMKVRDRLYLNPFDKHKLYGRFPWKFWVHASLVFVTTAVFLVYVQQDVHHVAASLEHFTNLLVKGGQAENEFNARARRISTASDLAVSFRHFANGYFHVTEKSIASIMNLHLDSMPLEVTWSNGTSSSFSVVHEELEYWTGWLLLEVKELDAIELRARMLDNFDGRVRAYWPSCFEWDLHLRYDQSLFGHLQLTLAWDVWDCDNAVLVQLGYNETTGVPGWMQCLLFTQGLLASLSCVLIIKALITRAFIVRKVVAANRESLVTSSSSWDYGVPPGGSLNCSDKLEMMNASYNVLVLLANAAQLMAFRRCFDYTVADANVYSRLVSIGVACSLAYFSMLQYISFFDRWYVMWLTVRESIPRVLRFMGGVLPLYLGYAVLGVSLWGITSSWYRDLPSASNALFSLLNGDIIHDTFMNLETDAPEMWWIAQIYLYSFLCVFIYVVLNLILSIIEESYAQQRCTVECLDQDASLEQPARKKGPDVDDLGWYAGQDPSSPKTRPQKVLRKHSFSAQESLRKAFKDQAFSDSDVENEPSASEERRRSKGGWVASGELPPDVPPPPPVPKCLAQQRGRSLSENSDDLQTAVEAARVLLPQLQRLVESADEIGR